jgi:hypothetical protein
LQLISHVHSLSSYLHPKHRFSFLGFSKISTCTSASYLGNPYGIMIAS